MGALERLLCKRWFNILPTLWINFRCFPWRQAWCLPLWAYGWPRLECLSGYMVIAPGAKLRPGMIRFNVSRTGAPNPPGGNASLMNCGTVTFDGRCTICSSSCIRTIQDSNLYLGNNSLICEEVNISCFHSVHIGHNSWIVHRSQVLESNNHYIADLSTGTISAHHRPIFIGNNCWVCNSSTISAGAILPDGTLVASHSLVNSDFSDAPANPTVGGIPAKVIGHGKRRVDDEAIWIPARDYIRSHGGKAYQMTPEQMQTFK